MAQDGKVLVVAFDGLDFRYLKKFRNQLPTFTRLQEEGISTDLKTTMPPVTPSAWPSFYTGTHPGKHEVFDFFMFDGYPDSVEFATRSDVQQPALWNYLSYLDEPSIVVNLPMTHPVEEINGLIVPGSLAPESEPGHPEGIRCELSEVLGKEYKIYPDGVNSEDEVETINAYLSGMEMRSNAATYLLDKYDWRLGIVELQHTDSVFHVTDDEDKQKRIYRKADDILDMLLSTVDDDVTVLVCSDHGIGPVPGYKVYLNQFLKDEGYVQSGAMRPPSHRKQAEQLFTASSNNEHEGSNTSGPFDNVVKYFIEIAEELGISSTQLRSIASSLGIREFLKYRVDSSVGAGINWTESTAFVRQSSEHGVGINLQGREPAGIVARAEYEDICDEIITLLESLTTPDGEPVFEWVAHKDDVYETVSGDGPDILMHPAGDRHMIQHDLPSDGNVFRKANATYHKQNGVLIAAGDRIQGGGIIEETSITDLAPTIMHILGFKVPNRMTGSPITSLINGTVETKDYDEIPFGNATKDHEAVEEVEDHLEKLGYI